MDDLIIKQLDATDLSKGYLTLLQMFRKTELTLDQAAAILRRRIRSRTRTYVAITNNVIVGTASLVIDHKFINNGGIAGFIEDVVVHKEFRNKGYGAALLEHIKSEASKLGLYKLVLTCEESNEPFYEKSGFHKSESQMRWDCPKE